MRLFITIISLLLIPSLHAQETGNEIVSKSAEPIDSVTMSAPLVPDMLPATFSLWNHYSPFGMSTPWDLHEGLNAQIGMGVTVGWGKNNPFRGGSFFTDVSLVYAKTLDEHWTLGVGGTASRFRFFNETVVRGSVEAFANYKFNEHLSGTIYGAYHDNLNSNHSTLNAFSPFLTRCAEVGADLTYKFNNGVEVGLGYSQLIDLGDTPRPWLPRNHNKTSQPTFTPVH